MSLFLLKCEFIFKPEIVPLILVCKQQINKVDFFSSFFVECDVYSDKKLKHTPGAFLDGSQMLVSACTASHC